MLKNINRAYSFLLLLVENTWTAIRVAIVGILIVTTLMSSFFLGLIIYDRWRRSKIIAKIISFHCRLGCQVIGISSTLVGDHEPLPARQSALIVSNHLSYLDVLVISKYFPSCFVTSVEIRETPILGNIAKWGNCLFVERRNKEKLSQEVKELTMALKNGLSVTVFPEATSTNGESVLRFRRPLYQAAVQSKSPVLPLCLNYKSVGGEKLNSLNRDSVFWYGEMTFLDHLWRAVKARQIEVELHVLDSLSTSVCNEEAVLAESSRERVVSRFVPCRV